MSEKNPANSINYGCLKETGTPQSRPNYQCELLSYIYISFFTFVFLIFSFFFFFFLFSLFFKFFKFFFLFFPFLYVEK